MANYPGFVLGSAMKRLLKDPLGHFLLLGLGLFVLFAWVSKNEPPIDDSVIEVDREALLAYIQYHAQAFSPEAAAQHFDALSAEELERLVDAFVREEALYREALALGMDKTDHVIKHRLVQSIEFITDDLALRLTEVTDADLEAYYQANRDRYAIEPTVTFTHVFFNAERHGAEQALALAEEKLAELNRDRVPFAEAPGHGDRFLYFVNYVGRTTDLVASHFGGDMAKTVFELDPEQADWTGPFESRYGQHLVLLTAKTEYRLPELDEVRSRIQADAEREAAESRRDAAFARLIDTYDIRRRLDRDGSDSPG